MANNAPYNLEAWQVDPNELYGPIKTLSVARTILPVEPILQEKDKRVEYTKWTQNYRSAYVRDPVGAPLVTHAMVPTEVDVPLIETGYQVSRVEKARVEASKLKLNDRLNMLANGIVNDENIFAIAGEPSNGVTSFADETNNTTAKTVELDVTTEALLKSTLTDNLHQLGTALGGIGNLKQFPLILGVTGDGYKKAMGTSVTGYAKADRIDNILDLATAILLKYGAPGSLVFGSDYIGGTVTKSDDDVYSCAAGTTNSVLYPWSKMVASIYSSKIYTHKSEDPIEGVRYQYTERWVPVFKHQEYVLHGGDMVIS